MEIELPLGVAEKPIGVAGRTGTVTEEEATRALEHPAELQAWTL